ncbi:MAG: TolC family protein [Acidobacteria bacterium]|nr:TolC family protein [Acidobacteriota bacterium]
MNQLIKKRIRMWISVVLLVSSTNWTKALAQTRAEAQTGASESLTLPLAVDLALKTNPLTRATASGREIADAQVQQARAGRLPQVQLSETVINGNNPVFVFGSLLEQGRFTQQNFNLPLLNNPDPLTNFRFGVAIKAPLFDQWQSATRMKRAKLGQEQADAQTRQVEQQVRFETLRAFYGLLLAQAKKEVSDEAIKLAEADVRLSRDRVEAGTAVVSDLLAAEVQLAEARQQAIQTDGDIVTAEAALNTSMGLPVNTPQSITGQLVEKKFDLADQGELIRLAMENRPDLNRSGLMARSSEIQVQGARNEFLPRLDVFANFGASRHNFASGSGDYTVGASLTFNLFDAGRNARIAEARAAANLAASEQQRLNNQIRFEVVRAYQQFVSARERLKVAERIIAQASEALRITQDRYQAGLTTITEVLRAETTLTRARLIVLSARHDYYVGYANVLLATGKMTDVQPFIS